MSENKGVANTISQSINEVQDKISNYSAFSLKSIQNKKKLEATLFDNKVDEKDKPKDHFTEEQLNQLWDSCVNNYFKTGRMLMAANMQLGIRNLKGNVLEIEFPSEGIKISFEENVYDLVNYLRRKLNNYDFLIQTFVNEQIEVKKAFTLEDKMNHLKTKYSSVELLIKTFDLTYKY